CASRVYDLLCQSKCTVLEPVPSSQLTALVSSSIFSNTNSPLLRADTPRRNSVYMVSSHGTSMSKLYTPLAAGSSSSDIRSVAVLLRSMSGGKWDNDCSNSCVISSVIPLIPNSFSTAPISAQDFSSIDMISVPCEAWQPLSTRSEERRVGEESTCRS